MLRWFFIQVAPDRGKLRPGLRGPLYGSALPTRHQPRVCVDVPLTQPRVFVILIPWNHPRSPLPRPPTLTTIQTLVYLPYPMSTSAQSANPSVDKFTSIFNAASIEYRRVTGKHLETHPFAIQLDTCNSPEAISKVILIQAQTHSRFSKGDEKLMAWLDPTVQILSILSATLGEGIGLVSRLVFPYDCYSTYHSQSFSPAKVIFTGIGILLRVSPAKSSSLCIPVISNPTLRQ